MIKSSKNRLQTAPARRSRIRRDPLLVPEPEKKAAPPSPEADILLGVVGVGLFAIAIAILTVAFSVFTFHEGATAAPAPPNQFVRCGVGDSPNCVIDGETLRIADEKVKIAGMDVPDGQSPRCAKEAERARLALERLVRLLNGRNVTKAGNVREPDGELRTMILVDGRDVGAAMVQSGVARINTGDRQDWC